MLSSFGQLRYRNDELNDIFFEYLTGPEYKETGEIAEQYDLHTLYAIMTSYAMVAADQTRYFTAFATQLNNNLQHVLKTDKKHFEENPALLFMLVPDLTMYMNLWLTAATFASMQPDYKQLEKMPIEFRGVTSNLVKLFNSNPRWLPTQVNFMEASNISVSIALLKVTNDKFIGDIADILRMNLQYTGETKTEDVPMQQVQAEDLPNLAKSTFYMRNFKYSRDIYSQVHAKACLLHGRGDMPPQIFDTLRVIYTEQGILTESPFINNSGA